MARHSATSSTRPTSTRPKGRATTTASSDDEWLTLEEVLKKLRVSRRTWDRWRERGEAPRAIQLPGDKGPYRIRPEWLQEWIDAREQAAS
ncbi:helix-turn-helix domain-containing protein [Nonomuraea basaltis]|nr:helix-turn-helix domain-containing protein [Nonomuraea basaltis]